MKSQARLFPYAFAALLSLAANATLFVAFFLLPASWAWAWRALQILALPGDWIVDRLIGGSHGLGLVGVVAAIAANFLVDWILIYGFIVIGRKYLKDNRSVI